jgi:molybdopterin-containing oxidoreductase family iron-sulfur binding subunit
MGDLVQINGAGKTGKEYWRSLDDLAGTPKFKEWVENEFPGHAEEMLSGTSRRNLLKVMAASFGLAGLTACRRPAQHILPNVKGVEGYIPGRPMYYATAMSLGGQAQGLLVKVNDGRPTKIEGNPEHPFSLGATNSYHQAAVLGLYDPDRMRAPMSGGKTQEWAAFDKWFGGAFGTAQLGTGAGLRVLTEKINSPSLAAVQEHFLKTFPQAKWVEFESLAADLPFGAGISPVYNLERADVVLAVDSDFLNCDAGGTVLNAKQFGRRRRSNIDQGAMSRMYAVEGRFSVTGSMADHRLRMKPSEIAGFVSELAGRLGAGGNQLQVLGQGAGGDKRPQWLNALVKDLNAHRGRCLVVAGPGQPAPVHAAVHQINAALGNVGSTVTYYQAPKQDTRRPLDAMKELVGEMSRGTVTSIVVTGGNPAYSAPADLEFEANLKKVANSLYVGNEYDETAAAAKWAIPEAHFLESWGDATAPDGTVTIQQPVIQPLHGGKTAAEVIARVSGHTEQKAYDIVRGYWLRRFGGDPKAERVLAQGTAPSPKGQPVGPTDVVRGNFSEAEKRWRKALHDGIVPNTANPAATPAVAAQGAQPVPGGGQLELMFVPSSTLYDGRFANNGWLQELPDPMTKLTWDNAALFSPKTAREMSLKVGDVVAIERAGRKLEAPVMIQPGQADGLVVIALGYGRRRVGRVGQGSGVNANLLRTTDAMHIAGDVKVSKTGRTYPLAFTEEHHIIEDLGAPEVEERAHALVRQLNVDDYRKNPEQVAAFVEVPELFQLYETPADYSKGMQWGMAIDLTACTGCNACVTACQAENNIPVVGKEQVSRGREMHWIRLDRYYRGDAEDPQAVSEPMLCVHCETAPCENVCPVAATAHSPEGLNDMAYNRCVGTRYCSNNCPYKVRRFNYLNWHKDITELQSMVHNPDVTVRMRGVMEKCTYCVQRIQTAKIDAKKQGRHWLKDGEVTTACAQACPSEAIVFGNINDPHSRVAQLKKEPRNYGVLAELNTRPRTTYLAKIRNPNPELEGAKPQAEAHHG